MFQGENAAKVGSCMPKKRQNGHFPCTMDLVCQDERTLVFMVVGAHPARVGEGRPLARRPWVAMITKARRDTLTVLGA